MTTEEINALDDERRKIVSKEGLLNSEERARLKAINEKLHPEMHDDIELTPEQITEQCRIVKEIIDNMRR